VSESQPVLPFAGLRPSFKSRIVERVARSRDPIARLRAGPALELYYEAGDPHSQLCASLAQRLLPRLRVPLHIRLVPAPSAETYPEEARQRAFAALDATRIAPCYGLPAPQTLTLAQRSALQAQLAAFAPNDAAGFLAAERRMLDALVAGRSLPNNADQQAHDPLLAANAARREKLGHYLPAMWQYRGEWFWALDRLTFLEARLRADGLLADAAPLSPFDATRFRPEWGIDAHVPLEFWFSFRSPYSYLAAVELLRRRNRGLYPTLQVRPVLPMVMRGLPVPRVKRLYIVRDVKRCADAQGIPFGRIHDPVGAGAFRLLTVFPFTADPDTQLRYCAIAGQSVWAEGIDVSQDAGLRSVFERCGLDWTAAQQKLALGIDTKQAEANREALFAAGLWGVPSFRQGGFTTWGQDRMWMLDRLQAD
jgi:2-hydroxychromene-2-carboxylate isomerase